MKCVILIDHPSWAQALHANGLQRFAPHGIDVEVQLLSSVDTRDADACYCINMASVRSMSGIRVATCCASHAWMHHVNDPLNWRTRGVNPHRNSTVGMCLVNRADVVICRNTTLNTWARSCGAMSVYLPAGVNPELWHPAGRTPNTGRLTVGWSGQVNPDPNGRFKGYDEVWRPLTERLGDRYNFVENTLTANEALPWAAMRSWYASLDVFLCTATAEGTPNAPFIAAACGAAVVSTDVGQVHDWKAIHQAGLVVPDYGNKDEAEVVIDLIEQKLRCLEDSAVRRDASERLLSSIESEYSYEVLAPVTLSTVCGIEL